MEDPEEVSLLTQESPQEGELLDLDLDGPLPPTQHYNRHETSGNQAAERPQKVANTHPESPSRVRRCSDTLWHTEYTPATPESRGSFFISTSTPTGTIWANPSKCSTTDAAETKINVHAHFEARTFDDGMSCTPPMSGSAEMLNSATTAWEGGGDLSSTSTDTKNATQSPKAYNPLRKVKRKLAAWSGAHEQGEATAHGHLHGSTGGGWEGSDSHARSNTTDKDDNFVAFEPPGARYDIQSPSPSRSQLTPRPVSPCEIPRATTPLPSTPGADFVFDAGAKSGDIAVLNSKPRSGIKGFSQLSKQLSTLAAEEKYLARHRDSIELAHQRLEGEKHASANPLLSNTQDSLIINKRRLGQDDTTQANMASQASTSKVGGLSPILDASPPDDCSGHASMGRGRKHVAEKKMAEINHHPVDDRNCTVCEVERPRSHRLEYDEETRPEWRGKSIHSSDSHEPRSSE